MAMNCRTSRLGGAKAGGPATLGPGPQSGLRMATADGWCAAGGKAAAGHGWGLGCRAAQWDRTAARGAPRVPETDRCDFEKITSVG
jgi:hypothetical protein